MLSSQLSMSSSQLSDSITSADGSSSHPASFPDRSKMFDTTASLADIFGPTASGADIVRMSLEIYGVGGGLIGISWFSDRGQPNIVTHPLNTRRHDLWDAELTQSILERGVVIGVSGEPWLQYSTNCQYPLQAVTWASRCRGFYGAVEKEPQSDIIKGELTRGLRAHLLHDRMPTVVVTFLINYHNGFHRGAAVSFLEIQTSVPTLEAEWRSHCRETGQTVRKIGASKYESTMLTFIMGKSNGMIEQPSQFNSAKAYIYVCFFDKSCLNKQKTTSLDDQSQFLTLFRHSAIAPTVLPLNPWARCGTVGRTFAKNPSTFYTHTFVRARSSPNATLSA